MANDWLKIKVNDGSWGTTGQGPSGTTPVTISASSCDEAIARSATIVFKAGSLTKRLKVTQGIASSPKIQLVVSDLLIACGQTVTVQLTVSNVEELNSYSWTVTPSGDTNKVTISGQLSGTNVSSSTITIRNNNGTSGNIVLKAQLFSSQSSVLSSDEKRFTLTGSENRRPTITFVYGGTKIQFHSGDTETVGIQIGNITSQVTSFTWTVEPEYGHSQGVTVVPSSGTDPDRQKTLTVTNTMYSSGTSYLTAHVIAYFSDGTQSGDTASLEMQFLPPDYHFRLLIDTQPATTLEYNSSTTLSFHVEETEGGTIPQSAGLTWALECTDPLLNQYIERSGNGQFDSNYSFTSTLTNKNIRWSTIGVTFKLSLLKDGQVIDFIEGQTSIDRYINSVTLYSQPQLYLNTPEPGPGGNGSVEMSKAGNTTGLTILFSSNRDWHVDLSRTDNGFYIMGDSAGTATESSTSFATVMVYCPPNKALADWLQNTLRIYHNVGNVQRYVTINISYAGPYAAIIMENDDVKLLNWDLEDPAMSFPISANVTNLSIIYEPAKPTDPAWLDAYTTNINDEYVLNLATKVKNETQSQRPASGSIRIKLTGTYGVYVHPDDTEPTNVTITTEQDLRVVQSPKPTGTYTVYFRGVPVWSSDGEYNQRTFIAPTSGMPDNVYNNYQIYVTRTSSQGATVYGATYDLDSSERNGMLMRYTTNDDTGMWQDIYELPWNDSHTVLRFSGVKLKLDANNSFTKTATTKVYIYTNDNGGPLLWSGTWSQLPVDLTNVPKFYVTWQDDEGGTEGKLFFHVELSNGNQTNKYFRIYGYKTTTQTQEAQTEFVLISNPAGSAIDFWMPNPPEEGEGIDAFGNEIKYFEFEYGTVRTERIAKTQQWAKGGQWDW